MFVIIQKVRGSFAMNKRMPFILILIISFLILSSFASATGTENIYGDAISGWIWFDHPYHAGTKNYKYTFQDQSAYDRIAHHIDDVKAAWGSVINLSTDSGTPGEFRFKYTPDNSAWAYGGPDGYWADTYSKLAC
jgi:hypothetical protein